jgi:hypothetical protein
MLNAPIGFRDEEGTVNFYGRWCCCGYSQSMYHTFVKLFWFLNVTEKYSQGIIYFFLLVFG